jgi:hypothetical protein
VIQMPVKTFWGTVVTVVVFTAGALNYVGSVAAQTDGKIEKAVKQIEASRPDMLKPYVTREEFLRYQTETNRYWDSRMSELKDLILENRR